MNSIGHTIELDMESPRFLLYNNRPYLKRYFTVLAVCLLTAELVYFVLVFLTLYILKRDSDKFSKRMLKLHRMLTVLLAIQVNFNK
jgi:hypothetical protein